MLGRPPTPPTFKTTKRTQEGNLGKQCQVQARSGLGIGNVRGARSQSFRVAHKGRVRPSMNFEESQKVWKCSKLQGFSDSGSRWQGRGSAPEAPPSPPFLEGRFFALPRGERPTLSNLGSPPTSPASFDWPASSLDEPVRSLLPRRSFPRPGGGCSPSVVAEQGKQLCKPVQYFKS